MDETEYIKQLVREYFDLLYTDTNEFTPAEVTMWCDRSIEVRKELWVICEYAD